MKKLKTTKKFSFYGLFFLLFFSPFLYIENNNNNSIRIQKNTKIPKNHYIKKGNVHAYTHTHTQKKHQRVFFFNT